jgi:hypothetical protein
MSQDRFDLQTTQSALRTAAGLVDQAAAILRRASERAEDADVLYQSVWAADVARDRLATIAGDLRDAAGGQPPPVRVEMIPIGRPNGADSGGGFAHRALQALALCREAWGSADDKNRPRMEHAMGWLARAWLETVGYQRADVVRAVLTYGFDDKAIVSYVNAKMAEQLGKAGAL